MERSYVDVPYPLKQCSTPLLVLYHCHKQNFYTYHQVLKIIINTRLKKSNEMRQYADVSLLLNYSTCFGRPSRPSSGVHKTVDAASGTDHTVWGASFLKRDQITTFEEACSPSSMICTRGCNYSFMYC